MTQIFIAKALTLTIRRQEYKIYVDLLLKPFSLEVIQHQVRQKGGRKALELCLEQFIQLLRLGDVWEHPSRTNTDSNMDMEKKQNKNENNYFNFDRSRWYLGIIWWCLVLHQSARVWGAYTVRVLGGVFNCPVGLSTQVFFHIFVFPAVLLLMRFKQPGSMFPVATTASCHVLACGGPCELSSNCRSLEKVCFQFLGCNKIGYVFFCFQKLDKSQKRNVKPSTIVTIYSNNIGYHKGASSIAAQPISPLGSLAGVAFEPGGHAWHLARLRGHARLARRPGASRLPADLLVFDSEWIGWGVGGQKFRSWSWSSKLESLTLLFWHGAVLLVND